MTPTPRKATSVDAAIGDRLRDMRHKAGLSQTQIGAFIGVSFQQIQKYEAGKSRLSVSSMLILTEHFGISPASFLKGVTS